jgi:hypothetical protein
LRMSVTKQNLMPHSSRVLTVSLLQCVATVILSRVLISLVVQGAQGVWTALLNNTTPSNATFMIPNVDNADKRVGFTSDNASSSQGPRRFIIFKF